MPQINKNYFIKHLIRWYGKHARPLPWRETQDPYKIWISEIMLQQTTVNTVIPYYERWIKVFPDIAAVAEAPLEKILNIWQGLGYYQRARNIHRSAKIITQKFNGIVPSTPESLRALPGFGPYTIGAVLSIAFHIPFPIIDANIRKVFMRLLALKGKASGKQDKKILPVLEEMLPLKNIHIFNQALMELGALVCRHKEPLCIQCPLKKCCLAYEKGIQEIIPETEKKALKNITAVVALIRKKNTYFIQKRPSKGLLADLWEFPGGKVEKNESLQQALSREIREELNVSITSCMEIMKVQHFYTQFRVHLHAFKCRVHPMPKTDAAHQWVSLKSLADIPMPSGNAKIIENLTKITIKV